ncbi:Trk system potassium transporter TrkA [Methylovulum psychrotolerans]|jgi:trk system potassium uptake protein TrkA|uniref:Trk system potassium uptake protein TrkA n=1 Tax=Methylovulum psychrotolerans TaxID=1704499 RepID=A0A2S5CIB8_9GAMM|nr:Trk system potassium transporter TrkA [Methylovulum psychrotolerans]POZ50551.1 Trk system potassium transporter TrkA [Methylovulum psychrotolerans]
MKILILGAGKTGTSVAEALAGEDNDIVVVDDDATRLEALKERVNISTVVGNAAYPHILELAGVRETDLVIAVTDRDETNMLACTIIKTLYGGTKTIARVRAIDYMKNPNLFGADGIPIDIVISPEQSVMESIRNLIELPGVLHISDFANGLVRLFSVKVAAGGFLTGKKIKTLKGRLSEGKIRVAAIFRNGIAQPTNGESEIAADDEVFFFAPKLEVRRLLKDLGCLEKPLKRIIIAGGGHIGKRLALALEKDHYVKIIELNPKRARKLANELDNTIVLQGDCGDEMLLLEESIDKTDLFCAITDNDGENIIAAALAKAHGARKAICILNNLCYNKLLPGTGIDLAVLPYVETLGGILKHVRQGDVAQVSLLRNGTAEAIEAIAHHSHGENSVVGRKVDTVKLPEGIILGALIRNNEAIGIHHDTLFEEGDHVVMFTLDKSHIPSIEEKFKSLSA